MHMSGTVQWINSLLLCTYSSLKEHSELGHCCHSHTPVWNSPVNKLTAVIHILQCGRVPWGSSPLISICLSLQQFYELNAVIHIHKSGTVQWVSSPLCVIHVFQFSEWAHTIIHVLKSGPIQWPQYFHPHNPDHRYHLHTLFWDISVV